VFGISCSTRSGQRRGVTVFLVMILIPVLLGFGALVFDLGYLINTKADLQNAADAAALAATNVLAEDRSAEGVDRARVAAIEIVRRHRTLGLQLDVDPNDIVFGRAGFDLSNNSVTFSSTGTFPDAVRVSVKRSAGSVNGPTPLFFAAIFGRSTTNIGARATAALSGMRDIALVIDLTYTMNYDSQLFHAVPHTAENGDELPGMQINLRDIWCALDGPPPSRPYIPGDETETEYAGDTGPTVGAMNVWGSEVVPESYNPTTDSGLWYVARDDSTTNATITTSLLSRGQSADEALCLMSGGQDGSYGNQWQNRAAVITGLAQWQSGRPGGTPGGDGDNRVEDNELTWGALPSYAAGWNWTEYINYVGSSSTYMHSGDSRLRYRFGVKTFTNFLLERPRYRQTSILHQTPEQPLQAIKDAVQTFVTVLIDAGSRDQVSLETFDNIGRHQVDLTPESQTVADRLYELQAAHWEKTTNMGAGIAKAIETLTSGDARDSAEKVIIILSDGQPNTNPGGSWSGYGSTAASGFALAQARAAADEGIRIYAITVGWDANRDLMRDIASAGNGREFYAAGAPTQYTQELQEIFFRLGSGDTAMLVE